MSDKHYVCAPPPIEALLDESIGYNFWPTELLSLPSFNRQITFRQHLLTHVRRVFAALPLGRTLVDGLRGGFISEEEAKNLCNFLASLLESHESQKRLSLYLPFELLSPITKGSMSLTQAAARLQSAYQSAWESQLCQHEVRANYVDGDVLEPELRDGDHPRVVKAAHLIPGLLHVGHLTAEDVLYYEQHATNYLLKHSIQAASLVASDLGLMQAIPMVAAEDTKPQQSLGMTEGRAKWLASVAKSKLQLEKAEMLAKGLEYGGQVFEPSTDQNLVVAIEAVRIACLRNATVYRHHLSWLEGLFTSTQKPQVRDSLIKLAAHLRAKGLVSDGDLRRWNIIIPHLGGPFYPNRHQLEPTAEEILSLCKQTEEHPRLSTLVYPVSLVLGSRVKGYGLTEADCDIAIFVRPGVNRKERKYIEHELSRIYHHERFDGGIKLFWLTQIDDHLKVIDWSLPSASDGNSSWVYFLVGGLWFGEEEQIRILHRQLLVPYFKALNIERDDRPVYERWLEEMERDSLQYRLLHKGFERHFPVESPMNTKHSSGIDGQSAFYDPQYRRIATELFIRRVFLPQL